MNETFTYLYLKFDVNKAREILGERDVHHIKPQHGWSVLVHVDEKYAMTTDISIPVILAQIVLRDSETKKVEVFHVMIDGHHRNYRATVEGAESIPARVLTIEETFETLISAHPPQLKKMKKWAKEVSHA